jgi:hypothetical protein
VRPDNDSIESKHVAMSIVLCNKLSLTGIYTLYELDKHIGMTNVKLITCGIWGLCSEKLG